MRNTVNAAPTQQAPAPVVLRGVGRGHGSADHAAAQLRAATRYYEQHVIAWHALGRLSQARAAREAITRCRQKLTSATHAP